MKQFNKSNIQDVRESLQKVLDAFGKGLEVELSLGTIRFSGDRFRVTLKGQIEGALSEEAADYDAIYHQRLGLCKDMPDDLKIMSGELPRRGTVVKINDNMYQITGWRRRARKRKITITSMGGETYSMSESTLRHCEIISEPDEAE